MKLKDVRDKLAAKQDELGKVFTEAKTDDGQYDFNKVTCLGNDVKGSIAVAEKVKAMNTELDELAGQAETLEAAEKAAGAHGDREKGRRTWSLPGGGGKGNYPSEAERIKSLGEMMGEAKAFDDWHKNARSGGVDLKFDELWPSDVLAKAAQFDTIGSKATMTTAAGFAPESIRQPGFVEAVTRPIQLLDILPMGRMSSDAYKYMEETTRTHGAAETAQGGTYAESAFAFTQRSTSAEKITDSLPVTDEQLDDVPMIQGYANGRLMFGVRQRLDGQCLVGNGTSPNLRGLKNVAGIQVQAKGADPVPDVFFKMMTKIRTVGRAIPTHHVMHPTDWQNVRLLRTTDGVYIWGSPSEAGVARMWGLPVVECEADAAGTGYTGSFLPAFVNLMERRGVEIAVGYVGTQFLQGLRTIRADMRVALAWLRPTAFCQGTGL